MLRISILRLNHYAKSIRVQVRLLRVHTSTNCCARKELPRLVVLAHLSINQTKKKKETKKRTKQKRKQGKCFGKERIKRCYFSCRLIRMQMRVWMHSVSRNHRVNSFRVPNSKYLLPNTNQVDNMGWVEDKQM